MGRVELPGNPGVPYGGTCFVVGDGLLMTNRHVAQLFGSGLESDGLAFLPGIGPAVDFLHEVGSPPGTLLRFRAMRMIPPYFDMALVAVDGLEGHDPLWLDAVEPDPARPRRIAVIGYPAFDPRNRADVQDKVFCGLYNVKRLQPGLLNGRRDVDSFGEMLSAGCHDSSTLGGNSRSVLICADSGDVVGRHFAGIYKDSNFAIPAADLARDPRVIEAGVNIRGDGQPGEGPWTCWWRGLAPDETRTRAAPVTVPVPPFAMAGVASVQAGNGAVTLIVPLQITLSFGAAAALHRSV